MPQSGMIATTLELFFNISMTIGQGEGKQFKAAVDLERDGFCLAIPAKDTLQEKIKDERQQRRKTTKNAKKKRKEKKNKEH